MGAFSFAAFFVIALCFVPSLALASVFNPAHFTLANGLQVVVVTNRVAPVVSQMVWYKVGAADEVDGKTGLAHYLEHLMFRGTELIPLGAFSRTIAGQGGESNAFTSYDYTGYYERVEASRLPMIMQMEADRMQNLRITPDVAEPELRVVIEERQQRTDNTPEGLFVEQLRSKFMPDHPYGRPVIGWKNDIEGLTAEDAKSFYRSHYVPNNAVVVITGDVRVDDVIRLAAATYGRIPKRDINTRKELPPIPLPRKDRFVFNDDRIEQAEILWRFVAPSYRTQIADEAYAFEVLAEVLDSGEVGLLFQKLVREKSAASGVRVGYDPNTRGESIFSFSVSLRDAHDHRKTEKELRRFINKLADRGIETSRIADAKKRLQRSAIFAREGFMTAGYAFGVALTTGGRVADVEAWPERIDAVTVEQVNAALQALVSSKRQIMGILLPERHAPDQNQKTEKK